LRPDVVLLDVLLPDMSGFEVADELAADPAAPTVVLISSRSAADLGTRLRQTRARGFITKGDLTPDSLIAAIGGAP
jgi:CheY-like chemotaxis protein